MKSVGVRELKTHLSRYLSLVKNGEVIVVTDHNKIVAEIKQPLERESAKSKKKQEIGAYLDKLKSEGKLNRASRTASLVDSLKLTKSPRHPNWKEIYQHVREDRF